MFLNQIFNIGETYLTAEIKISENSRVDVTYKENALKDKELILFGLLVYARILRIESSKKEKESLILTFSDFYKIYRDQNGNIDYKKVLEYFESNSNFSTYTIIKKELKTVVKMKKKKDSNFYYLYTGTFLINPYSSAVYALYLYIWNNVEEKNRYYLFESFIVLSRMYNSTTFSAKMSVLLPNEIVNNFEGF